MECDRSSIPQDPFGRGDRITDRRRYMLRYGSGNWVEVDAVLYEAALREIAEDPEAAAGIEAAVIPPG